MASLDDEKALEGNLGRTFAALGFETSVIGGNGKPDGRAVAYLEHRNSEKNYSFTFDAKSTSKKKIQAGTAKLSAFNRHKLDYKADFAVVVAIDFEGADDPDSAVNKEATQIGVTLLRAADLAKIVWLAGPKQLGFEKLKELFAKCKTIPESSAWVESLESITIEKAPFDEILKITNFLIRDDNEIPNITSIRRELMSQDRSRFGNLTNEEQKNTLLVLRTYCLL